MGISVKCGICIVASFVAGILLPWICCAYSHSYIWPPYRVLHNVGYVSHAALAAMLAVTYLDNRLSLASWYTWVLVVAVNVAGILHLEWQQHWDQCHLTPVPYFYLAFLIWHVYLTCPYLRLQSEVVIV